MGSGGSSGKGRYAVDPGLAAAVGNSAKSSPRDTDATHVSRKPSEGPVSKRTSESRGVSRSSSSNNDGASRWHLENCIATDLCQASCIRDAWGFDESKKKEVSKKERIWSLGDGVRRDYGSVAVSRLYPAKIFCDSCGTFIVDRAGEAQFFFCWRCRRADRHYQLCMGCHQAGERSHEMGPQLSNRVRSREPHASAVSRVSSVVSRSSTREAGGRPGAISRSNSMQSPRPSIMRQSRTVESSRSALTSASTKGALTSQSTKASLSAAIPSGTWKGSMTEGNSRRAITRELSFLSNGSVTGSGDDGCSLCGTVDDGAGHFQVFWAETYAWGRLEVNGQLTCGKKGARLEGDFNASDGGKGLVELRHQP